MAIRRLPSVFYNWTSAVGALLAVVTFSVIVLLLAIDLYVQETTLYLGLLTFCILPVFLVLGLLLIAAGAIRERALQAQGKASRFPRQISIDLENPSHRNAVAIWSVGTAVFLLGTSVGTYKAYKSTESTEFCGELCHAVMQPEYVAYQHSPHARVECVECHIGPGAEWFVKAKLSGLRQVVAVLRDSYSRPIETPIHNLRPARETCEHCHWPKQFFGARKDVLPHYLSDEENTPYPITMLLKIGGGSAHGGLQGIHWHMAIGVEYKAVDHERSEVAWVRVTGEDGSVKEYFNVDEPLSEEELAATEVRSMDCMDCHNRPSHNYLSPIRSVNAAISEGVIDRSLPYIKREAVIAMDQEYATTPDALNGISDHLTAFYAEEYPEVLEGRAEDVARAVAGVQTVFQRNFFPEMGVSWRAYPDHIGHSQYVGCFRCHGDALETAEGETITKDCNTCHTIMSQGELEPQALSAAGLKFEHPVDVDDPDFEALCTECHEGGAELY